MDGFVAPVAKVDSAVTDFADPNCADGSFDTTDVIGYHTRTDIPNYWAYAREFVLQDHSSSRTRRGACRSTCSWFRSGRRICTQRIDPSSCTNALDHPGTPSGNPNPTTVRPGPGVADLRLDRSDLSAAPPERVLGVLRHRGQPNPIATNAAESSCAPVRQQTRTRRDLEPAPYFDTVRHDGQIGNIQSVRTSTRPPRTGTLPPCHGSYPRRT